MDQDKLQSLLDRDDEAARYFNSLPDYAQEGVMERHYMVHSGEDLRRIASNLMQNC